MSEPTSRRRINTPFLITVAIILIGVALSVFFGARAINSFRQVQYIRQQGLDRGNADPDAVRPWMTIRFIAVAYAVPEEYLYAQLGVPFDRRNPNRTLGDLNRDFGGPPATAGGQLPLVSQASVAISNYRSHPVVTGLRDVRPWMSIHYIANSTGVAEQSLFEAIGLPAAGNEDKPLDLLSKEQRYAGDAQALISRVQQALPTPKATP